MFAEMGHRIIQDLDDSFDEGPEIDWTEEDRKAFNLDLLFMLSRLAYYNQDHMHWDALGYLRLLARKKPDLFYRWFAKDWEKLFEAYTGTDSEAGEVSASSISDTSD
jgi:hypothetical protein